MTPKTDIWMPLYIADYLADTTTLDAEKSGAYLHLLMEYWRHGPIENDIDSIVETARLRRENARSIAQALLNKFFTLEDDNRWHQNRADREMAKWNSKKLKAKAKPRLAAKPRWEHDTPSIASSNGHALPEGMLT